MGTKVLGQLANGLILFEHTFTGPSSYTRGGGEHVQVGCNKVVTVLGMTHDTTTNTLYVVSPESVSRNIIFYRVLTDLDLPNGTNLSHMTIKIIFLGV